MLAPICDCDKGQLRIAVPSWAMTDYDETLRAFFDGPLGLA